MTDTTPIPLLLLFAAFAWSALITWIMVDRRSARRRAQERHLRAAEHTALPAQLAAKVDELAADPSRYDTRLAAIKGGKALTVDHCPLERQRHDHIAYTVRAVVANGQEQAARVELCSASLERPAGLSLRLNWTGVALVHRTQQPRHAHNDPDHGSDDLQRIHAQNRSGVVRRG